jgi:hypothetical protein
MRAGTLADEVSRKDATQEGLLKMMSGFIHPSSIVEDRS